jgi:hypothetical protein
MPNLYDIKKRIICVTRCEPAENCYVYFIIRNHVACHVTNNLKNTTRAILPDIKRKFFFSLCHLLLMLDIEISTVVILRFEDDNVKCLLLLRRKSKSRPNTHL